MRFTSLLIAAAAAAGLTTTALPVLAQTGVQFDGTNDHITMGAAPSLNASTFTLETWFKRTGVGAITTTGTGGITSAIPLLTKGRGEAEGSNVDMNYFLGIRSTDSVLVADYEEGTGQASPGLNHPIAGVTPVRSQVWYHAAVTFDGTTLRLYLNGKLESTVVVGAGRLPQSLSIQHSAIGTAMTSTGVAAGFFAGIMDEARVWNVARTQGDIQSTITSELTSGTGLIGRWGLNEGALTTAGNSIAGSAAGTLVNGPTWVAGSPFSLNYALQLIGTNGYATFGNNAALGLANFTIETWFRRDGTGATASTGTGGVVAVPLLTKGFAEADGSNVDMNYFLGIRGTDNVIVADFEEGAAGVTPGLNHPVAGVTAVTSGVWHHAAATYDGTTWNLYLDGLLENTLVVSRPVQSLSIQHAGLGSALSSTGAPNGFFFGLLDEARVWNVALSVGQLRSTINTPLPGPATGLVARWGMDEAAGTTIASSAGGSINGTITGTGWNFAPGAPFNLALPSATPPNAPSALIATALAHNTVGLSWTDNAVDETAFEVERSTTGPGGPFTLLATLGANAVSYTDAPLAPGSETCYQVRATNAAGPSAYTSVECATTPAEPNMALDFTGANGYVALGAAPGLNAAQFTVECWFRRDGAGAGTNTGSLGIPDAIPLIAKGRAESEGGNLDMNYLLGIRASDGVLCADFEEGPGGDTLGLNHPVAGITPVTSGVWHHAAATYDGSNWQLYLDGCLDATLAVNKPAASNTIQHASIGSALNSTGVAAGFFDGAIDEARVWSSARTAAEIQSGMASAIASAPGLIGRWGLNETLGTLAYSTAGPNGTLTGSGWSRGAGTPFGDPLPPSAVVLSPNGGETLVIGTTVPLSWNAADCFAVSSVDLELSRSGPGGPWEPIAAGIPNTGSFPWLVTAPDAALTAFLRVTSHDAAGHATADVSDSAFTLFDLSTPTVVATFTIDATAEGMELRWQVNDPSRYAVVDLERAVRASGPWVRVDATRRREGDLTAALDRDVQAGGAYWYRLNLTAHDGSTVTFGPVSGVASPVTRFELTRITPNPSTGPMSIAFALPREARVELNVMDIQGRVLVSLANATFRAGRHTLAWNGETDRGRVPAGVYFVSWRAGGTSAVRRVVINR